MFAKSYQIELDLTTLFFAKMKWCSFCWFAVYIKCS